MNIDTGDKLIVHSSSGDIFIVFCAVPGGEKILNGEYRTVGDFSIEGVMYACGEHISLMPSDTIYPMTPLTLVLFG